MTEGFVSDVHWGLMTLESMLSAQTPGLAHSKELTLTFDERNWKIRWICWVGGIIFPGLYQWQSIPPDTEGAEKSEKLKWGRNRNRGIPNPSNKKTGDKRQAGGFKGKKCQEWQAEGWICDTKETGCQSQWCLLIQSLLFIGPRFLPVKRGHWLSKKSWASLTICSALIPFL